MRARVLGLMAVGAVLCQMPVSAVAQDKDISVSYLRAAVSSLADGTRVRLPGDYSAAEGLHDATGVYLRNKGYSRFTIRDGDIEFRNVYCPYDSKAFAELLKVKGTRRFIFSGYKQRGERHEDAIFVTDVEEVPEREQPKDVVQIGKVYRLTMIDNTSSNRTVLGNIELGKPVRFLGTTLVLDEEAQDSGGVEVLRSEPVNK
jgi:hypothetical protein